MGVVRRAPAGNAARGAGAALLADMCKYGVMVLSVGTGQALRHQRIVRLLVIVTSVLGGSLALPACTSDSDPPASSNGATAGDKPTPASGGASSGGKTSSNAGRASGNSGGGGASGGSTGGGGRSSQAGMGFHAGEGGSGVAGDAGESGAAGAAGEASASRLEQARAEYRTWRARTSEPYAISSEIFALCRLPTESEQEFVDSVHGDDLYLQDWLDQGAEDGFEAEGATPFPVGATIVKEKLVRTGNDFELRALGIMLKREAGFDSEAGDWQFGYWSEEAGMVSGAAENAYCGGCHASSPTDFVFLDDSWRMP